jgi:TolB-like protein/Tfp pilus assembly protein PilF
MIGQTIAHYRITDKLGSGGMGVVYKAEDTRLGRAVALKFLPDGLSDDADAVERFKREAHAASGLNHPHICTVHDVGEHDGRQFIVMELLEGTSLDERIAAGPLPVDDVVALGSEIADALDAAHARGLIHRDVKPANIFVTHRGSAKLLDFGIAKPDATSSLASAAATERPLTSAGGVTGTVAYMSPEQVRGERLDARTDVFSLGTVLYEMATGRQAFQGTTSSLVHEAILNRAPTPAARLNPHLPSRLDEIITRALDKDRGLRYQTAADLRADLQRLRRDSQTGVPAGAASDRGARVHTRSRGLAIVGAVALAAIGAAAWFAMRPRQAEAIDSVAVLPFANAEGNADADYLSEGIAESLINNLSRLPGIRVTARSASFRYKDARTDPLQIGRELGVRAVVSGRVLQRADTLIVRAELVDVANGSQIWGDQYDRKLQDVLALQEDLSTEIAEKLRTRLTGDEKERLTKRYTQDPEAYQLYLKGRYYLNKLTPDGVQRAAEQFQAAAAKDPQYALAYAGLGEAFSRVSFFNAVSPRDAMPKAKAAAAKALEIDPHLADAHVALGYASFTYDWDWTAAEQHFVRARAADPAAVATNPSYAFYLSSAGRSDEAIAVAKAALNEDPVSASLSHTLVVQLALGSQIDAALAECHRTIELDPNFGIAYEVMAALYDLQGKLPEAVAAAERAVALSPGNANSLAMLGYSRGRTGDRQDALRVLQQLEAQAKQRYIPANAFATVYLGLGDKTHALDWLEKAYEERINRLAYIRREPIWHSLRGDARFEDLARRIGAPP